MCAGDVDSDATTDDDGDYGEADGCPLWSAISSDQTGLQII